MGTKLSFIHACATKTQKETRGRQKRQREVIVEKVFKPQQFESLQRSLSLCDMQTNIATVIAFFNCQDIKDALSTIHQYQLKEKMPPQQWRKLNHFKTSLSQISSANFGTKRNQNIEKTTVTPIGSGDEKELRRNASATQSDTPAASSRHLFTKFNQLPVVPSTQNTGVVTPQSAVAPVTPVAPAATESSSVFLRVPSE